MSSTDDEWTIISSKKKTQKIIKNISSMNISSINIEEILIKILKKYDVLYIFLYGSRARGTNRIDSDIDIMCFMKYPVPSIENLQLIKDELISNLNLNVDFVVMMLTSKHIININERIKCYYENVMLDAKCIYPQDNKINLCDLIDKSIKVSKI